jgi:hypothetical protein
LSWDIIGKSAVWGENAVSHARSVFSKAYRSAAVQPIYLPSEYTTDAWKEYVRPESQQAFDRLDLVDWRKAEDKHAREKATQDDAPRKGRGRPRKNVAGGAGQAVVKESAASRKRKAAELSKTRVGDSDGEEEDENDDEEEDEDEENEEEDDEEDEMSEIGEGTKAGAFGAPIQGRQDDPMDFEMSDFDLSPEKPPPSAQATVGRGRTTPNAEPRSTRAVTKAKATV